MLLYNEYLDRVYGGLLAMNAGIRLGAPVEPDPWTYARIAEVFGELRDYPAHHRRFAADDDANGPVYFIRALLDKLPDTTLTPKDMGSAWLEYTRDGKGMFWWGGEGISAEHTAYRNLKRGIPPPQSGSMAQNGEVLSQQIGGQIFVDSWGFVCPGQPRLAADYAIAASTVSHDGEALHGAAFIAGCIAAAFTAPSVDAIMDAGLALIPADSLYAQVVTAVRHFHQAQPESWRACMEYLLDQWGYNRYPGACHVIPNAGVCALALLYGGGAADQAMEIAAMCGWDTDCNAGSVGSILGVFRGSAGLPRRYREPINDTIVASGISGYLNIVDLPSFARDLAHAGCLLTGIAEPEGAPVPPGQLRFDFALSGSTHGWELSDRVGCFLRHRDGEDGGCLEIDIDRVFPGGQPCLVSRKTFFRRADFDDERYEPVFSPQAYPGQLLELRLRGEVFCGGPLSVRPCIRTAMAGRLLTGDEQLLPPGGQVCCVFTLPDTAGDSVGEIGFLLQAPDGSCGRVFLDGCTLAGGGDWHIDPTLQCREFGQLTPFSQDGCELEVRGDALHMTAGDEGGRAFTGNYYMAHTTVQAELTPETDGACGLLLRARGARSHYVLGLLDQGQAGIIAVKNGQRKLLAAAPFPWTPSQSYRLEAEAREGRLALRVNGQLLAQAEAEALPRGMVGLWLGSSGAMCVRDLHLRFSL